MKKKKTANVSESAKVTVTVIPKHSWDEKMTAIKKGGIRMAKEMREQGHKFGVEILAPERYAVAIRFLSLGSWIGKSLRNWKWSSPQGI